MKTVEINDIEYQFPASWDDVPANKIAKIHTESVRYGFKPQAAFTILLLATNLPESPTWLRFRKKETRNKIENIVTLPGEWSHTLLKSENFLGFVFKPNGLTHYCITYFRHKCRKYVGPDKHILNLKTIELVTAYNMFYMYSSKHKIEYLNKLIALIYRAPKPFNFFRKLSTNYERDARQKLNAYHWELSAERIASLDHGLKLVILRQFSTAWASFEKKHKALFDKSGTGKYDPETWIDILTNLAGGAFGTLEDVKMHNASEVFRKINKTIIDNREKIRQLKTIK